MRVQGIVSPWVLSIPQEAGAVLERLNRGDGLSTMLPQARALAKEYGDRKHVFWLDLEIYGLAGVPGVSAPFKHQYQKEGGLIFAELHRVQNVEKLTVEGVRAAGYLRDDSMPQRDAVAYQSVSEIERSVAQWEPVDPSLAFSLTTDDVMRHGVIQSEHQRVLERVRAYLHRFVSNILAWAEAEKENQLLLGRDYHVVVDSLEALQTGVGEELLAALGNLRGENPANWALAALACRNVILKLGRTLLVSDEEVYQSELAGRPLNLRGEMEKNKLCAFIDWHFRRSADESVKSELKRLDEVVRNIYEKGSKGKSTTRHGEAQQLVIDTFDFVSALERLTGLQPVTHP
jgi:hypothetical protein